MIDLARFRIISAVPSTSAGLVYGRAALLGLTSGEQSCITAYPKCPRSEDDLLYYLNNHRGGFFRFFNGGAAFGDDVNNQYNPNPYTYTSSSYPQQQQQQQHSQYPQHQQQPAYQHSPQVNQQPQPQQQPQLQQNLAAFQSIAEAINQSGGINLSNLGANANLLGNLAGLLGGGGGGGGAGGGSGGSSILENLSDFLGGGAAPATTTPSPAAGISDLVGNLLTGFIGNRFSGRKVSKRSISWPEDDRLDLEDVEPAKKESSFKRKLKTTLKKPKIEDGDDEVEGRIINSKPQIYSNGNVEDNDGPTKFSFFSHSGNKKGRYQNYEPTEANSESVRFESGADRDVYRIPSYNRVPQQVNFRDEDDQPASQISRPRPGPFFPGGSVNTFNREQSHKMIFPDRTGTGNLKFDNDEFESVPNNRFGKILNYGNNDNRYRPSFSGSSQQNQNQISFGDGSSSGASNNYNYNNNNDRYSFAQRPTNTYASSQQSDSYHRPTTSSYYQSNRYGNQNQIYNSQNSGHYPSTNRYSGNQSNRGDSNSSQNVYVTNSKGVIEYYINPQGKKVYV